MKKKIGLAVSLLGVIATAFSLSACGGGGDNKSHTHKYVNYIYNNDATCVDDGTETAKCKYCNEEDTRVSAEHLATGLHEYEDYLCNMCYRIEPTAPVTQGLVYTAVTEKEETVAYSVTNGDSDIGKYLKIPALHDGKPVTSIDEYSFRNCGSLTSIEIPNSVTDIGLASFSGCNSVIHINYMGDITSWCADNKVCNLTGLKPKTLIIGGKEVKGELVIPDTVEHIPSFAFFGCSGLTSVVISNGVTYIANNVFDGCGSLTSITIPNSVTGVGTETCRGCSALTNITYTGDIASWCSINGIFGVMGYATSDKTLVIDGKEVKGELVIPNTVTVIPSDAFSRCIGITSVVIPSGVTSIGSDAFSYCSSLTSVTIPDSVTSIGKFAFLACDSLTSATFANPNGWWIADEWNATSGESLSSADLSDASTAANYLYNRYRFEYWKRS